MITLALGISVYLAIKARPKNTTSGIQLGGLFMLAVLLDFIIFMTAIYRFS